MSEPTREELQEAIDRCVRLLQHQWDDDHIGLRKIEMSLALNRLALEALDQRERTCETCKFIDVNNGYAPNDADWGWYCKGLHTRVPKMVNATGKPFGCTAHQPKETA